jgi:hypothetical protein
VRRIAPVLLAAMLLAGCANVAPWQRGHLARPDMVLEPTPALRALDKTYAAKEAGSGGAAVGGGGCGCN